MYNKKDPYEGHRRRMIEMNKRRAGIFKWECYKREWIDLYNYGFNTPEIAELYKKDKGVINKNLKDWGVKIRPLNHDKRKYQVDESFFSAIDTEEKAYWLGFIAADGNVNKPLNRVYINLAERDRRHIEKFLISIKSNTPIDLKFTTIRGKSNPGCYTNIGSTKMANDLNSLGVVPNKSLILQPCILNNDKIQKHYWRGVIDGDGCLTFYKNGAPSIVLVGTKEMCKGFVDYIYHYLNIPPLSIMKKTNANAFFTQYGGQKAKEVITHLYKDATIFLDRKMILATKVIEAPDKYWFSDRTG